MRYIDRYNSIKVPYCIFCIYQRFLCKRTFQHKAFFSLNEHGLQTEIFFYKECFIVFVIHDKTWDMRWKERKKERQTPEAMKKSCHRWDFNPRHSALPAYALTNWATKAAQLPGSKSNILYTCTCVNRLTETHVRVYIQRNLWWMYCTYMLYMLYMLYILYTCIYMCILYTKLQIR